MSKSKIKTPDILTAGFPCQGMSVAGKGGGFSDDRSALFFEFIRIAKQLRPTWLLIENVPGFFTAPKGAKGRDFTIALAEMDELGYGLAWTSLDAQHFGLAQRRERVFIVGHLGSPCPPEILFDPQGGGGNSAPGGEEKPETAGEVAACLNSGGHRGGFRSEPGEHLIAKTLLGKPNDSHDESLETYVIGPLCSHSKQHGHAMTTQQAAESNQLICFDPTQITSKGNYSNPKEGAPSHPLAASAKPPMLTYSIKHDKEPKIKKNLSGTLQSANGGSSIMSVGAEMNIHEEATLFQQERNYQAFAVRRLTPRECERLQGFPDNWTAVKYGKKTMSDSARYRMLGLAVAVPVVQWILRRLKKAGACTIGEIFSGIGGFALAARREEMKVLWASEIDPQAQAIYAAHFPDVELVGDIRKIK